MNELIFIPARAFVEPKNVLRTIPHRCLWKNIHIIVLYDQEAETSHQDHSPSTDDNLLKTRAPETEGVKVVLGSTETDKKTPELVAKSNKSKIRTQTSIKIIFRPGQSTISRTLAPNLTATNNTVQIINLSKKNITDAEQNYWKKV